MHALRRQVASVAAFALVVSCGPWDPDELPRLASRDSGITVESPHAPRSSETVITPDDGAAPGDTHPDEVIPDAGAAMDVDDRPFTIVIMPDTQYYSVRYPEGFYAQTRWIAAQAETLNIRFVLHEGDITETNAFYQWEVADAAMRIIDGVVPYAVVAGNHDIGVGGSTRDRTSRLDQYFPVSRFLDSSAFGGVFEAGTMQNAYYFLDAGAVRYLIIALEFGPRDEVLAWASSLCQEHPNRTVMLLTHSYLNDDGTLVGPGDPYNPHDYPLAQQQGNSVNDGEEMWSKLVSRHANIRFVFNGHLLGDGTATLISTGAEGNVVVQMLANYQMRPAGGQGFLRVLTFTERGNRVAVRSYSPWTDAELTSPDQRFTIDVLAGEVWTE